MWILIDMSFLAHRARHSLKDLESEDMPTGVLYGFFEQLMTICSTPRFTSNKVCIFCDSRHSWRSKQYPEYKKKRRENRTEEELEQLKCMHQQVDILRKQVLPAMGIPVYGQKGLESDDLLAIAAQQLTEKGEKGVLVTSDGDLYQCITPHVGWYDPQREQFHNVTTFTRKKGVTPEQWGMVKAIGGCNTDGVAGIKGVSEKGAIDYLFDKIPHHYKKYESIKDAFSSGKIEYWKDLVVLPHKKTKPVRLREPEYNPEAFYDFCMEYDIDSYVEGPERRQWDRFFKGRFSSAGGRRRYGKR